MLESYVPKPGDVVWLEFDPQAGHEQKGTRPAVILSPMSYNAKTSMVICCPITNQTKGYPFEVAITDNSEVTGVVLADQVKSLDWRARKAEYKGKLSADEIREILSKIKVLTGIK